MTHETAKEQLQREWEFLVSQLESLPPEDRQVALRRLRRLSDDLARLEQLERLGAHPS